MHCCVRSIVHVGGKRRAECMGYAAGDRLHHIRAEHAVLPQERVDEGGCDVQDDERSLEDLDASTRIVIIKPAAAPSIIPMDDASTTAPPP